jgi:hypothetical protein
MKVSYIAVIIIILSSLNNLIFITQTPFNIYSALASTVTTIATATKIVGKGKRNG